MKAVFKTGWMVMLLFFVKFSSSQNLILLKDRIIKDTTWLDGYNRYQTPGLYQARIIDGYIYAIELHGDLHGGRVPLYLEKYDLNGNLIKRKMLPFLWPPQDMNHYDVNIDIYKADANNLILYLPFYRTDSDTIDMSHQFIMNYTTDLDSVKTISYAIPASYFNDTIGGGPPERHLTLLKDGNYILLTGGNEFRKTIQKMNKNLDILWRKEIDTTVRVNRFNLNNNRYTMQNSAVDEIDGKIYISSIHPNASCWYDNYHVPECDSLGKEEVHLFILDQNGNLISRDSISLTYTNTSGGGEPRGIRRTIARANGFHFILTGYLGYLSHGEGLTIADYDSITKHVNVLREYRSRSYEFGSWSQWIANKGFRDYNAFYQFNSDYSSATLNQLSVKPLPDSFYVYYGNRFIQKISEELFWADENIDSTYLMLGRIGLVDSGYFSFIIPLTNVYGTFKGKLIKDNLANCSFDNSVDQPFKNLGLEVRKTDAPAPYVVYGGSDVNGNFQLYLDTGTYRAKVITPNDYWSSCPQFHNFTMNTQNDTVSQDFYIKRSIVCPHLSVTISTLRLRPCTPSVYNVQYSNNGTADAQNAYVTVEFDSSFSVNFAAVPYTHSGNLYTFQLGTIPEDTSGQFIINGMLNCDVGLETTICATAHIYPDSICTPVNPLWDHSKVTVTAQCLGDSVKFTIKNTGTGNMNTPKKYYLFENDMMIGTPQNFQLNAGREISFKRSANGNTQRITADQSDYFPYPSAPTAVIENCGGFSPGFVTQFPNDDAAPFISIRCLQPRNSHDPNDKEGIPTGVSSAHLISKGTDIDYKINFQNTGNDTAYDIYILDTISPKLDITTLQMGAASHSYTYEIYGTGILKVVFRNINLVDSFQNEPLSHGFFTYRISQDSLTKNNDKILNSAFIYFDSNHPVQTNTTLHTVTENFFSVISSVVENKWKATTTVYPNPFNDKCTIEIKSEKMDAGNYHFTLFDIKGQIIEEQTFENKIEIYGKNLNANLYLFRIEKDGETISNGKIVKQ